MELKNYQQRVLRNLRSYVRTYAGCGDAREAYQKYLAADGIGGSSHAYHNVLGTDGEGRCVPKVCVKVPTGGGKTFIAVNALSVVTDELPESQSKVVVWLVPRAEILRQTIRKLRDPGDPLRIALDRDFEHRVEVLDKESGLRGVGLTSTSIGDQLTLFVLSYDSFKNKDGRRAFAENSALVQLTSHQKATGAAVSVEGADDTALITALAGTNPIVVVDESHHAGSSLSVEMLRNLNPRFMLELTATPTKDANIISRVTARELKAEHMVKLPVIVHKRDSKVDVIRDAVLLRRRLEQVAQEAEAKGGRYIRPIVLFQAEPKVGEDAETFEKLKDKLVKGGIPEEQVAIRTGDVDQLGKTDLMSRSCPIRYIITVEALSEGWDCPFAYVLATVSNKNSKMSVEQIVGRILRQPYVSQSPARCLNTSYVLTSSNDFNATIDQVVKGLNGAGFSKKDVSVTEQPQTTYATPVQQTLPNEDERKAAVNDVSDDGDLQLDFTPGENTGESNDGNQDATSINKIIAESERAEEKYEGEQASEKGSSAGNETGLGDDMDGYHFRSSVAGLVEGLMLPQFVTNEDMGLFSSVEFSFDPSVKLDSTTLLEDFSLYTCSTDNITFEYSTYDSARQIDVDSESDEYKVRNLAPHQITVMRDLLSHMSAETKMSSIAEGIYGLMSEKFQNTYGKRGLLDYIKRVVQTMDKQVIDNYVENSVAYTKTIMKEIKRQANRYAHAEFLKRLDNGKVYLDKIYCFPKTYHTNNPLTKYDHTLYEAEDGKINGFERKMAEALANCPGILWWHRIIERKSGEFYINGFTNHYPDFIACSTGGRIIAIETKGEQLKDEARRKLELGRKWADRAGMEYRYYMVFMDDPLEQEGSYSFAEFKKTILNEL